MNRALVLSGGGPVGIAWETGIAAGLAEAGVSLAEADLIIGTSAGSVVGAQLAMGRDPRLMLDAQIGRQENAAVAAVRSPGGSAPDLTGLMAVMAKAADPARPLQERLREVGRFALEATPAVGEAAFIAGFGTRLAGAEAWPAKDFRCTAIDASLGSSWYGTRVQVSRWRALSPPAAPCPASTRR